MNIYIYHILAKAQENLPSQTQRMQYEWNDYSPQATSSDKPKNNKFHNSYKFKKHQFYIFICLK